MADARAFGLPGFLLFGLALTWRVRPDAISLGGVGATNQVGLGKS
jgi:hypothetical protein